MRRWLEVDAGVLHQLWSAAAAHNPDEQYRLVNDARAWQQCAPDMARINWQVRALLCSERQAGADDVCGVRWRCGVKAPFYVADLFAGCGGTSTGLIQAAEERGSRVELVAVNHWEKAVETHARNHPGAQHHCMSIDSLDPRKAVPGGRLDLLWASPECTHHSRARGGKPMSDQSRATAWCVLRWADALAVEVHAEGWHERDLREVPPPVVDDGTQLELFAEVA